MENLPTEKKIWVTCPTCLKTGTVPVDRHVVEGVIAQAEDSLLRLMVFPGDICDHSFTVTVDANLKTRHAGKVAS